MPADMDGDQSNMSVGTNGGPQRQGTILDRAGTHLQRAGSNLGLQRASTLPTEDRELRHAATMPITHDVESIRPCCCGLWKLQQMVGFILATGLLLIMCIVRPMKAYPYANDMLGITLLCGIFWVFEVVPIYITSLAPVILMPLFGITSSEIAAQAYWNMIQMLVIGTYLVDIALEEVHLPRRAALKLLLTVGVVQPGVLLFMFMILCWALSMFCNNIAVTLMVTPFAIEILNAAEEQARDEAAAACETTDSDEDVVMDASTKEVQRFSSGVMLGIAYASTCGGLATLTGTVVNEVLYGVGEVTSQVTFAKWFEYAFPTSLVSVVIAYLILWLRYCRGLQLRHLTREVLETEYEELVKEIGPFSRDELFVGLIQIVQFVLLFLRPELDKWMGKTFTNPATGKSFTEKLLGDPTLACLPASLLFFIPSTVRPGQALLTWPAVHEKFDFGLLLLIGGGFAIAQGFTESGLNIAMGQGIAGLTEEVDPFLLNFLIILFISFFSQIFSAIGTATTTLPTLYSAALNACHNPLAFVVPATIACSFAFMLPTATPSNVVVLAKSQDLSRPLRIRDYFWSGLPLNLMVIVAASILTFFLQSSVFDANSGFPKWACDCVSCIWVPVPGYAARGGPWVHSQACMVNDEVTNCTLWNKTVIADAGFIADAAKTCGS